MKNSMAPLGLYLQIPFCASKCTFCNFSSRVAPSSTYDDYCVAVSQEIERTAAILHLTGARGSILQNPVDTIYFGGGTPPILGAERLQALIGSLHKTFQISEPCEFTIEATPGSLTSDMIPALRRLGVNRLSIGAQSFVDKELASVGRLHTASDTLEMIAAAREAGFDNVSVDLIAGLPHQTGPSWKQSLEAIGRIRPEHVSVYIFEIDEKSRLGSEVLKHGCLVHASAVPDESFTVDAYEGARATLRSLGYSQYEISNFALPGRESIHNLKYWQLEPYVGLGAGAHSFDGAHRWSNVVSPVEYFTKLSRYQSPIAEFRALSQNELIEEFFFTGLRQASGVDWAIALKRWSEPEVRRWEPTIDSLVSRGLLERHGGTLRLTDSAYIISNEVFQEFLQ
jgi:oxygen-independent coproporphyrinogen III oxidase